MQGRAGSACVHQHAPCSCGRKRRYFNDFPGLRGFCAAADRDFAPEKTRPAGCLGKLTLRITRSSFDRHSTPRSLYN
jgi:hypothetical protein